MKHALLIVLVVLLMGAPTARGNELGRAGLRILLLTKSSGFEHSVIKHDAGGTSHVERIMVPLAETMGATLEFTKDASVINADNLARFDVVVFYTSGDLRQVGTDGHPAMAEDGLDVLFDWIRGGGGFVGFHSATDSFASGTDTPSDYTRMVGGEFVKHGAQFEGTIRKVSPEHPAVQALPERWALQDEWYLFKNLNKEEMHVLALLEIGDERKKQRMYTIPDYPMIWCLPFGDGRVLYNGMGHREDVWEDARFKELVVEHIRWAAGEGALAASPNYEAVVPVAAP